MFKIHIILKSKIFKTCNCSKCLNVQKGGNYQNIQIFLEKFKIIGIIKIFKMFKIIKIFRMLGIWKYT